MLAARAITAIPFWKTTALLVLFTVILFVLGSHAQTPLPQSGPGSRAYEEQKQQREKQVRQSLENIHRGQQERLDEQRACEEQLYRSRQLQIEQEQLELNGDN